jgi:hypothetical protein
MPALLFTTEAADSPAVVTLTVTGISGAAYKADGSVVDHVDLGDKVYIRTALAGSVNPASYTSVKIKPDSATYSLSVPDTSELNSRTYIRPLDYRDVPFWETEPDADQYAWAVLNIQKSNIAAGDSITVACDATDRNPSGATTARTTEVTVQVGEAAS